MKKRRFFYLLLFAVFVGIFSSCLEEEMIYHQLNDTESSSEPEIETQIKESSLLCTEKQDTPLSFTLTRNINLKVENYLTETISNEKLSLKFKVTWDQADTIQCESCDIDIYTIFEDSRIAKQTQNKHNILVKTYQYDQNFNFDKISLNFNIEDEQAFYQKEEQQLEDFKFQTLELKKKDRKFEYEFIKNGKKISRYKCTFEFATIFKNTQNDALLIEAITRHAWLDIINRYPRVNPGFLERHH